jgi:hypothetical protein
MCGRYSSADNFSEQDWNFDNVPKSELEICCLWEYARESAFLHSIRERGRQSVQLEQSILERIEFVGRDFWKAWNTLGRKAILFQEGIYWFGGREPVPNFVSRFPCPWASLTRYERRVLLETAAWNTKHFVGLPSFRRAHYADALAMPKLFKPKALKEVFGGDGNVAVRDFFHAGHKLRSICPNYMSPSGHEVLIVAIDWGRFTNEQLVKDFAQWVKENDPPGIARPDRRGRNKEQDWRTNLTRLAVMRLLSRYTLNEILGSSRTSRLAECQPILRTKQFAAEKWGDLTKWYDARREAGRLFRMLFTFLPKDDKPLSWKRQLPAK